MRTSSPDTRPVTGSETSAPPEPTGVVANCVSAKSSTEVNSVLFVCWANVCRSPAAVAVLNRLLSSYSGDFDIRVESAGVCVDEIPSRPSVGLRWTAWRRGYRLCYQPRQIRKADLDRYDLVIAVDRENMTALEHLHARPAARVKMLADFLPGSRKFPRDVPDPMHKSLRVCELVFDMLESAAPSIASYILGDRVEFDD